MKVDPKFSKTGRAEMIDANYTSADYSPYYVQGGIRVRIYGVAGVGDLKIMMNPLEAHRLIGQINEALQFAARHNLQEPK